MSKYSSDSDSYTEKRSSKKSHSRRSRERSYSSDSSSSRSKKRKDKKYRKERSRSRGSDKYSRSRVDRSSSYQSKSYNTKSSRYSNSPDRSRKRSNSRDRYKSKYKRSKSRERSSRKSRSSSRNRHRKSRKSHSRDSSRHKDKSPSISSTSSRGSYDKKDSIKIKDNDAEKSSKSTDSVKYKLKKLSVVKEEESKINSIIIDEINDDSFAPKAFVSSKSNKKVADNIVIDLKSQTIKVPDVEITEPDSIFHPNLFMNEEARMEKWVKELYVYRQKAFNGELNNIEVVKYLIK